MLFRVFLTGPHHGRILDKYSRLYNGALIAPELNNHGHSVVNTLKNECRATLRVYIKERSAAEIKAGQKNKHGWETTESSKYFMLDELDTAFRKGHIRIRSQRTLKQMRSILRENGKIKINGKDRIVAAAIAWVVRKSRPLSSSW